MMTIAQLDAARKTLVKLGPDWAAIDETCFVRRGVPSDWIRIEDSGRMWHHRRGQDGRPVVTEVVSHV